MKSRQTYKFTTSGIPGVVGASGSFHKSEASWASSSESDFLVLCFKYAEVTQCYSNNKVIDQSEHSIQLEVLLTWTEYKNIITSMDATSNYKSLF